MLLAILIILIMVFLPQLIMFFAIMVAGMVLVVGSLCVALRLAWNKMLGK